MHQCEFCCWYTEGHGTCECPVPMKRAACEKARKEKERIDEEKKKWKEQYDSNRNNISDSLCDSDDTCSL